MNKLQIPANSEFDSLRAMELANLIERAYQQYDSHQAGQTWLPDPGQTGVLTGSTTLNLNATDAQTGKVEYKILNTFYYTGFWMLQPEKVPFGFIAQRQLENGTFEIFVVFRGTQKESEWISDFQNRQVPFLWDENLGWVGRGFNKIYTRPNAEHPEFLISPVEHASISKVVLDTLSACSPGSQVFVTGHSLGGALATLATLHIKNATSFKQPTLYTFASPRVGDPTFAAHFTGLECFRIANSEDIVPTVPPATTKLIGEDMLKPEFRGQVNDDDASDEEMLSRLSPGRFETAKSLRQLETRFLTNTVPRKQLYQHIGMSLYFTDQRGSVSYNHNMAKTYREALP
ncbi:lipase family protein [Phormidesmis priestleyi ULC007]|uniref:Lipase family protein n=1 Tax=Phormidesmis priestleyi ULC007 TaxID=1920490 RepID=A0A2T1D8V2_9CYAN|nr:lipase family protein [Phormidesmis priestleyi]PSB16891.1 lipase family protein [Phormidesmis priestleyi ULC007]PZO47815.1 MAG: lipase family protein [Phormidesmis priestleyi]